MLDAAFAISTRTGTPSYPTRADRQQALKSALLDLLGVYPTEAH